MQDNSKDGVDLLKRGVHGYKYGIKQEVAMLRLKGGIWRCINVIYMLQQKIFMQNIFKVLIMSGYLRCRCSYLTIMV